jgi:hypothetical protein
MPVDAVEQVADAHGRPFLGIRGMSDRHGDPLNLPGYSFTFTESPRTMPPSSTGASCETGPAHYDPA